MPDQQVLSNALGSQSARSLLQSADKACQSSRDAASNSELRVSVRADSARAALACARLVAAVVNLTATADQAGPARQLMVPWLAEYEQRAKVAESESEFLGLKWGIGLGVSRSWGSSVDDAEIASGVVRARSNLQDQPRVVLEYHKYLWCNKKGTVGTRGCGPFIAAAATDKKVLSGVGLGFMYGVKTRSEDSEGFSVGFGAILDGSVKSLAEGFVLNAAPSHGETELRYETRGRWATLLFVSRSF